MPIRLRFKVISLTDVGGGSAKMVNLAPVFNENTPENAHYRAQSGQMISLGALHAHSAEQFEVGNEYFLDFTSVHEGEYHAEDHEGQPEEQPEEHQDNGREQQPAQARRPAQRAPAQRTDRTAVAQRSQQLRAPSRAQDQSKATANRGRLTGRQTKATVRR